MPNTTYSAGVGCGFMINPIASVLPVTPLGGGYGTCWKHPESVISEFLVVVIKIVSYMKVYFHVVSYTFIHMKLFSYIVMYFHALSCTFM